MYNNFVYILGYDNLRHIVFLLAFLLSCQQTNASPIHPPSKSEVSNSNFTSVAEKIMATKPSWHDPCGIKHRFRDLQNTPQQAPPPSFMMHVQRPNDNDLLHGIVNMAKMALRKSRHFKEDYVSFFLINYHHSGLNCTFLYGHNCDFESWKVGTFKKVLTLAKKQSHRK